MELRYKLWCEECRAFATTEIKNEIMAGQALEASDHPHRQSLKIISYNKVVKKRKSPPRDTSKGDGDVRA